MGAAQIVEGGKSVEGGSGRGTKKQGVEGVKVKGSGINIGSIQLEAMCGSVRVHTIDAVTSAIAVQQVEGQKNRKK